MSVHDEFQSLIDNCDAKRKALVNGATRLAWWHKVLNVSSGVLALISTGSITAAIAKLANNQTAFQIASLMFSLLSGLISLVLTQFFDQKSIQKMLELSVDFAGLREKLILEALKAEGIKDEAKNLERLKVGQSEYTKLNRAASKLPQMEGISESSRTERRKKARVAQATPMIEASAAGRAGTPDEVAIVPGAPHGA